MSGTGSFKKILDKLATVSASNMGKVLVATSVIGWIASSAAQILGIVVNDKYTKKQKQFLIPQEMMDAITNIGAYLALTLPLRKLVGKCVSTGKIAPRKVLEFFNQKNIAQKRGKLDFDLRKHPEFEEIQDSFIKFNGFTDAAAAIAGGVLSSNIITPIIRNKYAARKQRLYNELNENNSVTKNPTTNTYRFNDFRNHVLSI